VERKSCKEDEWKNVKMKSEFSGERKLRERTTMQDAPNNEIIGKEDDDDDDDDNDYSLDHPSTRIVVYSSNIKDMTKDRDHNSIKTSIILLK
jgi:hypothetical protein